MASFVAGASGDRGFYRRRISPTPMDVKINGSNKDRQ